MMESKELRQNCDTPAGCKQLRPCFWCRAADAIDQLTRERDEALRKVALFEPVVSAARDWARDVGDCYFCGYDGGAGKGHGEDCPMPDAQRVLEQAEEKR